MQINAVLDCQVRKRLITGQNDLRISGARLNFRGLAQREGPSRHTIRLECQISPRMTGFFCLEAELFAID